VHALVLQAGQQSIHVLLTLRINSENKKPHLFQMEKDLCKNIRQASTPHFPVPAGGWEVSPQEHVLTKFTGPSPDLRASSQLAVLHPAAPRCGWLVAEQHGGRGCSWAVRALPCPLRKEFPGFLPLQLNPPPGPYRPPRYMKVQIQLISAYISA